MKKVIVSDGLSGHRVSWLEKIAKRAQIENPLYIYLIDKPENRDHFRKFESMPQNKGKVLARYFDTKSKLVKFLENPNNEETGTLLIFWDAEEWIKFSLFTKRRCRLLFMRPYRSGNSYTSSIRYLTKILIIRIILLKTNLEIGLLSIPGDKPKIFVNHWIDDDFTSFSKEHLLVGAVHPIVSSLKSIDSECVVLGVIGFISARKNPNVTVSALRKLREQSDRKFILIFIGTIEASIYEYLVNLQEKDILVYNQYLDEDEYESIIRSIDLNIMNYSNVGSSGSIIDSLLLQTPVVFSGDKHWKSFANANERGFEMTSLLPAQVSDAVIRILDRGEIRDWEIRNPNPKLNVIDFLLK